MPARRTPSASRQRTNAMCRVIRDRICLLEYPPGHRLSEQELAREFAVSRTPVRHALAQLESEKLIDRRHGAGTFVTELELDSLEQVIRFRMALAELIGTLEPKPPTEADVAAMRDCHARLAGIVGTPDPRAFARINQDYFLGVTALIGNVALRETSERLFYQTTRMWVLGLPGVNWPTIVEKVMREVDEVAHAMALGDMRSVGLILRNYISMNLMLLLSAQRNGAMPEQPTH